VTKTTRIRWHHVNGTVVEWFGYVGTLTTTALFQIRHPVAEPTEAVMGSRFDEWALCTTFPGESGQARYAGDRDGTKAVAELKAEAERWLERIISSLGAVFPEDDDDTVFGDVEDEEAFRARHAPGRRVRFAHPDGGYPADQKMAAAFLAPGEVYTIAWSDIGFSSTRLGLAGIEDRRQGFNSMLFETVDDADPAPSAAGTEAGH